MYVWAREGGPLSHSTGVCTWGDVHVSMSHLVITLEVSLLPRQHVHMHCHTTTPYTPQYRCLIFRYQCLLPPALTVWYALPGILAVLHADGQCLGVIVPLQHWPDLMRTQIQVRHLPPHRHPPHSIRPQHIPLINLHTPKTTLTSSNLLAQKRPLLPAASSPRRS